MNKIWLISTLAVSLFLAACASAPPSPSDSTQTPSQTSLNAPTALLGPSPCELMDQAAARAISEATKDNKRLEVHTVACRTLDAPYTDMSYVIQEIKGYENDTLLFYRSAIFYLVLTNDIWELQKQTMLFNINSTPKAKENTGPKILNTGK